MAWGQIKIPPEDGGTKEKKNKRKKGERHMLRVRNYKITQSKEGTQKQAVIMIKRLLLNQIMLDVKLYQG